LLKTLHPESSAEKRHALEEAVLDDRGIQGVGFRQELKTALPVSPKRLEEKIRKIERMA